MNKFQALIKYFPAGTAAGERTILERVFVKDEDFVQILTPSPGNPRLLVGKKGAGKSAFLDISQTVLTDLGVPVISLVPSDLQLSAEPGHSIAEISREFLRALVQSISTSLAKGLKFVSAANLPIYQAALESGDKQPDAIARLAKFVTSLEYKGISFDPAAITEPGKFSLDTQVDAVRSNIERTDGAFFLLMDDIDQVSTLGGGLDVERIYACLLAMKKLAADVPQLRIVVTLRDEVWRALGRARSEKIDQLDHFSLVVSTLSPSKEQIKQIVRKRLEAAASDVGIKGKYNEYEPFFEGAGGKMPSSEQFSSWDDLIVSRCRERPRDAVQLVNRLAVNRSNSEKKIDDDVLAAVMPAFSRERVELLQQEYVSVCPQLGSIVESLRFLPFSVGAFTALTSDVKKFIEDTVLARSNVKIDGRSLSRHKVDDVFTLWRLLYDVGVLNPRVADDREVDKYRHISPRDQPDLVSLANWNDMQAVVWEIHPAYRDRLYYLIREDRARSGLAVKPPRPTGKTRR